MVDAGDAVVDAVDAVENGWPDGGPDGASDAYAASDGQHAAGTAPNVPGMAVAWAFWGWFSVVDGFSPPDSPSLGGVGGPGSGFWPRGAPGGSGGVSAAGTRAADMVLFGGVARGLPSGSWNGLISKVF